MIGETVTLELECKAKEVKFDFWLFRMSSEAVSFGNTSFLVSCCVAALNWCAQGMAAGFPVCSLCLPATAGACEAVNWLSYCCTLPKEGSRRYYSFTAMLYPALYL